MTRTDILIRFIKKSIAPIITAILLYNLFAGLCIANGSVNYMYLLMLCGIPFGIRFMFIHFSYSVNHRKCRLR